MEFTKEFTSSSQYRFKRRLGAGGSADVLLYSRVIPGLPDQDVVIKVLKNAASIKSEDLFKEGLKLNQLKHPNIVTTFGYEKINGTQSGLVLEYIPGQTLKSLIPFISEFNREEMAIHIFRTLLNALASAHEQNVIHGDVSARNLMITSTGHLKVTDFGLISGGSIDYMAPEQWSTQKPSVSSDIFSAGIIAYEILTGQNPIQSKTISSAKKNLEVFLSQKPWQRFEKWAAFFDRIFDSDPLKRSDLQQVLSLLPKSKLPDFEIQKELVRTLAISALSREVYHTSETMTLLGLTKNPKIFCFSQFISFTFACCFFLFLIFTAIEIDNEGTKLPLKAPFYLTLTSWPWGEVLINGVSQGYTPVVNLALPIGYHELIWKSGEGDIIRKSLFVFGRGSAGYKIQKKKGQPIQVAPIITRLRSSSVTSRKTGNH